MNALQRLIQHRMRELDLTYAEVGKRGGLPHNTVWVLANKTKRSQPPRAGTLEKLAKGLDLPLDLVRSAAASAAGYQLEDITTTLDAAEDVRIVAAVMGELSESDREKLRAIALAFQAQARHAAEGK